ncbi:MAG TPA: DUF6131 family protein [Pseudonocardia sp.]|jgi:hypothetical protein|nr:DUF6131 family protein [Pseudonocardia sp.]
MIVLGIILCVIGWATGIAPIYTIGSIVLAVGLIFLVLGLFGRPVAGRTWY